MRNTEEKDLAYVLETEKDRENKPFVGQWDSATHIKSLTDVNIKHLVIEDSISGKVVGYLILRGFTGINKSIELMRIAITDKGRGFGKAALETVKQMVFSEYKKHRLWLDVRENNNRAKNIYESCGFKVEGLIRECVYVDDHFESLYLLSILEDEIK